MSQPNIVTDENMLERETMSKFNIYSLGVLAANKPLNSKIIEVIAYEHITSLSGEVNDDVNSFETKGAAADGSNYESKLKTTKSISAQWLPVGGTNRITPPDLRRGAMVILYQYGDTDKYYWTAADDFNKRKLETVIWGFSNTRDENEDATPQSMYFVEVSTHKKIMHIHTSDNDGEVCTYDIQINGKEGHFVIQDGIGNYIKLSSANKQFHIESADGSFFDLTGDVLHIKLGKKFILECPETEETTNRTQKGNTTVKGNATTTGKQSVGSLAQVSGSAGAAVFNAPVEFQKIISFQQGMKGDGDIETTGEIFGSNID